LGRKHTRSGKQVYFHITVLICLSFWFTGCSFVHEGVKTENVTTPLSTANRLYAQADYAEALKEYEKILASAGSGPEAEEAHFYSGLIYASPRNVKRDTGKSLTHLKWVTKNYPHTSMAEHARTLISLLQEYEELNRSYEKQNAIIEQLKRVDIGIEDKKRERAK
jgi:hypothetical protein